MNFDEWIPQIIGWLLGQVSEGMKFVLMLLPRSPFIDLCYDLPEGFNEYLHLFFYLFPAHRVITTYAAIVGIMLIYYVVRVIMNWVKMIGS